MQKKLFKDINLPKSKSLVISKGEKKALSKSQDAFNKLTQKIERLQIEIKKKQWQFDLALKIYADDLYPARLKIASSRYKLIIILWQVYKDKKLSNSNQRHLKSILKFHLQEYIVQKETAPDAELQHIFEALEGISYLKMMQREKEKTAAQMDKMFESMGMNFEEDDAGSMAEKLAAAAAKLAKKNADENNWYSSKPKAKKNKTARQLDAEKMQHAIAEMKQKNISTIYKQLAKLFHPDLEQDETQKLEKEILMKELTVAYEAKNLHALLTLELNWIHKENDHLETLTEEKLSIYLQILKEQARDLELQKAGIYQQPQYAVLANQFGYTLQRYPVEIVQQEIKNVNKIVQAFEREITDLEKDNILRHVNAMIKEWMQQEKEMSEDEILNMLWR